MARREGWQPPVCKRCGRRHFNFLPCDEVDGYMGDLAERRGRQARRRQPHILRQGLPEGWQPWGDRLETIEHRQGVGPPVFRPKGT